MHPVTKYIPRKPAKAPLRGMTPGCDSRSKERNHTRGLTKRGRARGPRGATVDWTKAYLDMCAPGEVERSQNRADVHCEDECSVLIVQGAPGPVLEQPTLGTRKDVGTHHLVHGLNARPHRRWLGCCNASLTARSPQVAALRSFAMREAIRTVSNAAGSAARRPRLVRGWKRRQHSHLLPLAVHLPHPPIGDLLLDLILGLGTRGSGRLSNSGPANHRRGRGPCRLARGPSNALRNRS